MKEITTAISETNKIVDILNAVSGPANHVSRAAIVKLESLMMEYPQIDIPVAHRFCGNMYLREIVIPKGTMLTGRIQKFDHFDIMLSGDITVSTDSEQQKRITGLNIFEGKAGKKRAGYAHEDTHWITVHSAEVRDAGEMYEFLTCDSFESYENFNVMVNRADYRLLVESLAMTQAEIDEQVLNQKDMIYGDTGGCDHLSVSASQIDGHGVYGAIQYEQGDLIAPARIGDKRTVAGRFTNHALNPNAEMQVVNGGVNLVALKQIPAGDEVTVNYRNVLSTRYKKGDLCQE